MPAVGDPFGATDSFVAIHEPPMTGFLDLRAFYGRFTGFALGDWMGSELRLSVSAGQPATLEPVLNCVGDVDGSGY